MPLIPLSNRFSRINSLLQAYNRSETVHAKSLSTNSDHDCALIGIITHRM